ncbi:MAG: helix-turn-helix transcriptional regulator [Ferruginibacter sp.]
MLTLNLTPIFKARGIEKPYTFLVKAGIAAHTAHRILNSKTRVFRLDHIEILCTTLLCQPNDLLLFTADNNTIYADNNPLLTLKQQETTSNLNETIKTMTYNELQNAAKAMNSNIKSEA